MSVHTTYDGMRNALRDQLSDCLGLARELLDENTWGYEDMRSDYALDVYLVVKKARDSV